MYRRADTNMGEPCRIYRDIESITSDIYDVSHDAEKMRASFNIRTLLLERLTEEELNSGSFVIPALENALFEAEESLLKLKRLEAQLDGLKEELYETLCVPGH